MTDNPDASLADLAAMLAKVDWRAPADRSGHRVMLRTLAVHVRDKIAKTPRPSPEVLRAGPLVDAFIYWSANPNDQRLADNLRCAFQFYADGL